MAGQTEAGAIERFIYEKLSVHTALTDLVGLRIAPGMVPQTSELLNWDPPYVIVAFRSGRNTIPLDGNAAERISGLFRYMIYAVTNDGPQWETVDEIALVLDARLHELEGAVSYLGRSYYVRIGPQEEPIRVQIPQGDLHFNQAGGIYVIQIQPQ